jgi:hypothetical protein
MIVCEGINVAKVANPGQEIQSLAALSAPKIKFGLRIRAYQRN